MTERFPENVVICIDCSRSMSKTDYTPNRLLSGINALKKVIELRLKEDTSSTFALITFSNEVKKVLDFTSSKDLLFSSLDSLSLGGHSLLGDAMGMSIKMEIIQLRKTGAKIPRILLVSDGNYSISKADPIKMAELAKATGIRIDSFRTGEMTTLNILKRISKITNGIYYFNNDSETLLQSAYDFAESNIKRPGDKMQSPIERPSILRKIAADLIRIQDVTRDLEERIAQIRGKTDFKKCSICFSREDPHTKGNFALTGVYCPNCMASFHIHCLTGWALSQKDYNLSRSNTCRCPYCFYLLKIPTEVVQLQKLRILSGSSAQRIISESSKEHNARVVNIKELGEGALYQSCPLCSFIFEIEQNVVACENPDCGTLYHEECFQKLQDKICKKCGVKLNLE